MNERIKELALQARHDSRNEMHYLERIHNREISLDEYQEIYDEKFSELIMREMCQVINADCELQYSEGITTNLGGLNQARELIKQHFGVEE